MILHPDNEKDKNRVLIYRPSNILNRFRCLVHHLRPKFGSVALEFRPEEFVKRLVVESGSITDYTYVHTLIHTEECVLFIYIYIKGHVLS